ncbi:O-antigen ligase family protein [Devosia sp. WQ 349]|uniref:O-antigen ligase family protein n=1 Tax=Devosia sp. WQ 349K1 TaxID=2800329 RepID=UPI00190764DF|nr:O-antigen ligase family protein [Devosia sp. WQ 349K1]
MTLAGTTLVRKRSITATHLGSSTLNHILAIGLVTLATLAPLSLGANNASAWSINGAIVGLVALIYCLALMFTGNPLRVGLSRLIPETLLATIVGGFIIFQALPTSLWGGSAALIDVDGNRYALEHITASVGMTVFSALCYFTYALFFFLVFQVSANRQRALFLAEAAFAAIIAHAVLGLIALTLWNDSLLFLEKWAYHGVATGTFVNRNSYGTFLAIGFVLGVGLTLRAALSKRSKLGQRLPRADEKFVMVGLQLVGTVLILAALLSSQSRMGLAAALAGGSVLIIVALAKTNLARSGLGLMVTIAFIVVSAAAFFVFGGGTLERLGSTESDSDVRQQLYAQVAQLIEAHWLWGTGAGTFELVYPLFHRWPVSPDLIWDKAHNTYLTLWSELGLVVGTLPLIIFAIIAARLLVLIKQRSEDWWLPAISLSALVVVATHSLVDFSMEIQGVVLMLLFVVGLGLDFSTKKSAPLTTSEPAN